MLYEYSTDWHGQRGLFWAFLVLTKAFPVRALLCTTYNNIPSPSPVYGVSARRRYASGGRQLPLPRG
jgi:hypothetical protein